MAGIPSTEKFANNTNLVQIIDDLFATECVNLFVDLYNLYTQIRESKMLSNIVFDSNLFEYSENFDKELFSNIYTILSSYANVGTHEAIIILVKNILGSDASVLFDETNILYDVIIDISSSGTANGNMITTDDDNIVTTDNNNIAYVDNRLDYTEEQLRNFIAKFIPIGIKYQINFS